MLVIFNDTLGAFGGSHTLMLRMCKWLYENGHDSMIICESASNTEIVKGLEAYYVKICPCDCSRTKELYSLFKSIDQEYIVINFAWNQYLDIEILKKKFKLSFTNYVYSIHPATFEKGSGFKTSLLRNYSIKKYQKCFVRMLDNHSIVMMDEQNKDCAFTYLKIGEREVPIVRLPMIIEEKLNPSSIDKGFKSNTIITSSRADFPYKGYLIGLVEAFNNIYKSNDGEVQLIIVAAGDDIDELHNKIAELDEDVKGHIHLHGWMDYSSLKELIRESKLFVGMGTSVLDAALCSTPSIAVSCNTYDVIANDFLYKEPQYLGAINGSRDKFISLVNEVLSYEYDNYRQICSDSYEAVNKLYNIEELMPQLITVQNINKNCILRRDEIRVRRMNVLLNRIRYRHKKNDYNNINANGKE